jgi:hypothetical protein
MTYKTNVGFAGFLGEEIASNFADGCDTGAPTSRLPEKAPRPDIKTRHSKSEMLARRALGQSHAIVARQEAEIDRLARMDGWCPTADDALALLHRLKSYALPAGRISAARKIVELCTANLILRRGELVIKADYPASILFILHDIECRLIAIGGYPDQELAEAVETLGARKALSPSKREVG